MSPAALGGAAVLLSLTTSEPDDTAARMVHEGSEIIVPIQDRSYGKHEGRVRDPFEHLWILSCPLGRDGQQASSAQPGF